MGRSPIAVATAKKRIYVPARRRLGVRRYLDLRIVTNVVAHVRPKSFLLHGGRGEMGNSLNHREKIVTAIPTTGAEQYPQMGLAHASKKRQQRPASWG